MDGEQGFRIIGGREDIFFATFYRKFVVRNIENFAFTQQFSKEFKKKEILLLVNRNRSIYGY